MGELITFAVITPVSIGAAVLMLLQRNAVHAALFLILNQFTLAVYFVLLDAHFLAAVQVIVYAGAIMVLFLFVIMFLGVDRRESLAERIRGQRPMAIALGVLLVAAVAFVIQTGIGLGRTPVPEMAQPGGNVRAVGEVLFTDFVFPFQVTAVLLIVAAIAAMVLASRAERRLQPPAHRPEPAPETTPGMGTSGPVDEEPVR